MGTKLVTILSVVVAILALMFLFMTLHERIEQAGGTRQIIIDSGKEIRSIIEEIKED